MAIDPIAPVSPIPAAPSVGADSATRARALLTLATAAVADNVAMLGALVGDTSGAALAGTRGSSGAAPTPTPPTLADLVEQTPETTRERLNAAVRSATAQAAPRQAGLSPMMANLDAIVKSPDTPEPVRQAAREILDKALPADRPLSTQAFRAAVRDSGLFMESRLARTVLTERPAGSPASQSPSLQLPDGVDMKAALLVFRAVVATWVTKVPLHAASSASVGDDSKEAVSPQTTSAPAKLGAAGIGSPRMPSPGSLQRAPVDAPIEPQPTTVSKTGPLNLQGLSAVAAPFGVRPDLAAVTTLGITQARPAGPTLPDSLQTPTAASSRETQVAGPRPTDAAVLDDVAPESDSQPALVASWQNPSPKREAVSRAVLQRVQLNVGLIEEEPLEPLPLTRVTVSTAAPRDATSDDRPGAPSRPPPPYAGGPTTGQPVARSDLPADMRPSEVARHLLSNSHAALARQELLQIASLPEARREAEGLVETKSSRWMFDLPFQTLQGIAVAQFEISRDGDGGGGGASDPDREEERTWRARFSLDIEPLGPVHVQIALTGARTRVGFWAERPEAVARLQAGEGVLSAALREADLSPEVAFHDGAPVMAPSALGRFVDRAS